MNRIIAPAAFTPNAATVPSRMALGWLLSLPSRLWQRQRSCAGLRNLLDAGPHLIADAGMAPQDLEQLTGTPIWQSPHVPPLRHF